MTASIKRPRYEAQLQHWRNLPLIKAVTGIRRCGKSTLLELFRQELRAEGVPKERLLTYNLEDPAVERAFGRGLSLYDDVVKRRAASQWTYVFIDEAQHLPEFERTVTGLNLLDRVDVYVTGSNSRFLSGDLATRLTGRYVEISMLPLSYAEFISASAALPTLGAPAPGRPAQDALGVYLDTGGFPFALQLPTDQMRRQYLTDVLDSVILKDVATRQESVSPATMSGVAEFLFDNVGNLTTIKKIADTMSSAGRRTGRTSVDNYVAGLVDAYLFYPARRYDIKGKAYLENSAKYFAVDLGMRRAMLGSKDPDLGHQLENLVFLELLRRGAKVHVGRVGSAEVDFVAEIGGDTTYYQVAARADDPGVLERELSPLMAIEDNHPKILLTASGQGANHSGIQQIDIRDWLLDDPAGQ